MRNINYLGLVVCGVCVAASLAFSAIYGLTMSEKVWLALTYAGVGVAAVIWEVVGAHRLAHLWRTSRRVAAVLCAGGLMLATTITITYELGLLAYLFESNVAVNESHAGQRGALEDERARLQAQLAKAGATRGREAVEAELAAVRASVAADPVPRAELMRQHQAKLAEVSAEGLKGGCGDKCKLLKAEADALAGRLAASNSAGSREGALVAELGLAMANERAQARIAELNASLEPLASAGVPDARARYVSEVFGTSEQQSRVLLAFVFIVFLFFGRVAAPFVFVDARRAIAGEPPVASGAASPTPPAPADEALDGEVLPSAELLADDEAGEGMDSDEAQVLWEMEQEALLAGVRAEKAIAAPIETPLETDAARKHAIVRRFIADTLIVDPGNLKAREVATNMQEGFKVWQDDNEIPDVDRLDRNDFGYVMKAILRQMGGDHMKSGSQFYVGVMFKPTFAHRIAQAAGYVEKQASKPAEQPRRLGAFGQDRRAMVATGQVAAAE